MTTCMLQIATECEVGCSGQFSVEIDLGGFTKLRDGQCSRFSDQQIIALTHLAGAPLDVRHDLHAIAVSLGALDLFYAHDFALVNVP